MSKLLCKLTLFWCLAATTQEEGMNISQVMRRKLITLDMDDTLANAKNLFESHNIHHLLIKDNDVLTGIITDRDLWQHLSPTVGTRKETSQDSLILNKKVHLIMERDLVTATKDISLTDAILLFHDKKISCLPVVNDNNTAIGIITWRDIIQILAQQHRRKNLGDNNVTPNS